MEKLAELIISEIDEFAKEYENSIAVDDLVKIRKGFYDWFISKKQAIYDFYRTEHKEKMSLVRRFNTFKLRLTFYSGGRFTFFIDHYNSRFKDFRNKALTAEYQIDLGYVYFIESQYGWKIGKTKNIKNRHKTFDVKLPFDFALRYFFKTAHKTEHEKYLHTFFHNYLINGEWFLITKEQIKECVRNIESVKKLSKYENDKDIFIQRDYLEKILKKAL